MRKKERPAPPPRRKELSDNPVKLCNEISRIWRGKMRERREGDSILSQQGARLILSFLAIGDGTTQLELVKATHLTAPTVSLILKEMESGGLVHRETDPIDKRAVRVYLTDAGRELDADNIALIKSVDESGLKGLNAEEIDTLMILLAKIRNNLLESEDAENGQNS